MEVGRGHLGDGRAGVCPACLLITSCYPSGRETPQAALTLSAPQLYPQGASGQHPPRQAAGSVHLACGPLQGRLIPWHKLESPPLPTHTPSAAAWGKRPGPSKSVSFFVQQGEQRNSTPCVVMIQSIKCV